MIAGTPEQDPSSPLPEEEVPKAVKDLDAVRAQLSTMVEQGRSLEAIEILLSLVAQMRDAHTATSVRLQDALRQLYGRRSEKTPPNQLQLVLSALLGDSAETDDAAAQTEATSEQPNSAGEAPATEASADAGSSGSDDDEKLKRKRRKAGPRGRVALPEHLERRVTRIEPAADVCTCAACGEAKREIGLEVSERLEFEPPSFFVRVEERPKLACGKCRNGVTAAEASATPLPGALPGPGLLSLVVTSRFKDGLPLHRQTQIYERRYGVRIASSTLGAWCAGAADLLPPLVDLLKECTLADFLVQTDDTGHRVLDRGDPRGIKRGHLWIYVGDGQNVFVDYTPDWSSERTQSILKLRTGYIQHDGYAGYDALFGPGTDRISVACWMHARRGFERAMQAGDVRGATILLLVQKLYRVEKTATEKGCTPQERLAMRVEHSTPVYVELFELLEKWQPEVPPKTPLGKAITYALNRQVELGRFLDDGRLPLDNGEPERLIRLITTSRKNSLFLGSDAAGHRAANALSLVLACHRIGIDPWAYFRDILPLLGASRFPASQLDQLLPLAWAQQQPQHAAAQ